MKVQKTHNKRFHFDNTLFDSPLETADFDVFQAGDLYCGCGFATGEHTQSVPVELTFVERGSGFMFTNGRAEKMKQGRAYLSLSGDRHDVVSDDGDSCARARPSMPPQSILRTRSRLSPVAN